MQLEPGNIAGHHRAHEADDDRISVSRAREVGR